MALWAEAMMGAALALLLAGFLVKGRHRHAIRIAGWVAFAAYWPLQASAFFAAADPFNGWMALLGPIFILYIAFHEWMSWRWGEDPPVLRWFAGATALAAAPFFVLEWIPLLAIALQHVVSIQTEWMLALVFGVESYTLVEPAWDGGTFVNLYLPAHAQPYAVTIILACTAVQSIMIFVGAIVTVDAPRARKRRALLLVVPVIWILNLFRNAGIVYGYKVLGWNPFGWGGPDPGGWKSVGWSLQPAAGAAGDWLAGGTSFALTQGSFEWMHIVIGKGGSLAALILIALAVFAILPELHGRVLDLFELPRRRKPAYFAPREEAVLVSATNAAPSD